jgi:hypothetical protein
MAPFRSHFCLNPGLMPLNEVDEGYDRFWSGLSERERNRDGFEVAYLHSKEHRAETGRTLYERIDEDTFRYPLHLMELKPTDGGGRLRGALEAAVAQEKRKRRTGKARAAMCDKVFELCEPDPHTVSIRGYDNTISIAQMELRLTEGLDEMDELECGPFLDALQSVGIGFADNYIRQFYGVRLFPFLKHLSEDCDPGSRYIRSLRRYDDFRDMPAAGVAVNDRAGPVPDRGSEPVNVLWVTRTLIFEEGDHPKSARGCMSSVVEHWLRDIGDEKKREQEIREVKENAGGRSLSWLNYAFRENAFSSTQRTDEKGREMPVTEFCEAWESMLMSQYYYSALECLNDNLQRVIRRSYAPDAEKELRDLSLQLKRTTATTNQLIIHYSDIQKYLQRDKKTAMGEIMEGWSFRGLIDTAEKRIAICNEQVAGLHRKSTERSALVTDLLLFGIGALSLVSLSITLAQAGRQLMTDATLGFRDDGPLDLFGRFSGYQMDWVLLVSLALIVVFGSFYWWVRRKKLL